VEKDKSDSLIAKLTCTKMKDAVEPPETWFKGSKRILNFPESGEEEIDSLVFTKTGVVKNIKSLKPEISEFFELAKDLVGSDGVVDREELRKKAMEMKVAKDATQVRGRIRTLRDKNLIEIFDDRKRIRILDSQ
jgi:hypothetical protein